MMISIIRKCILDTVEEQGCGAMAACLRRLRASGEVAGSSPVSPMSYVGKRTEDYRKRKEDGRLREEDRRLRKKEGRKEGSGLVLVLVLVLVLAAVAVVVVVVVVV